MGGKIMTHPENSKTFEHDYIIVGAGPAGLQLGYFFEKAGRDYLILEAGDSPGTFFKSFPRHRTLISSNKVYTGFEDTELNLRWDWNSLLGDNDDLLFKNYSKKYFPPADEFVSYLADYADHYKLKINYGVRVTNIKKDERFTLQDDKGNTYSALRLIIATGFTKPFLPDIPGIELAEPYTEMSTNPEEFTNQRVLVLGKGNSGFETADNLIETAAVIHVASPEPLNLAWKTHFVGHLRAVNNNFLDTYQLKTQNAVIDACVEKIERRDGKLAVSYNYSHANGEKEELLYDRVLACTGFRFDASIFDETSRPNLVIKDRFPEQTCEWESTNVKDLYFAGTLTQMRDFKKTTSGFIHGFRYNVRALWRILEQKYHGVEWPSYAVAATPERIAEAFLKRINKSSALWQQFGFLCDLIVVSKDGTEARYYEELPVDYVRETSLGENEHYYIATLEFGKITGDPFSIERFPDTGKAERSTFLHPVIRHYSGPNFIAEQHLLEDLNGEWVKNEQHVEPLKNFLRNEILAPA
jgi:thioredoxin reductase